jgi:hypothetical protein
MLSTWLNWALFLSDLPPPDTCSTILTPFSTQTWWQLWGPWTPSHVTVTLSSHKCCAVHHKTTLHPFIPKLTLVPPTSRSFGNSITNPPPPEYASCQLCCRLASVSLQFLCFHPYPLKKALKRVGWRLVPPRGCSPTSRPSFPLRRSNRLPAVQQCYEVCLPAEPTGAENHGNMRSNGHCCSALEVVTWLVDFEQEVLGRTCDIHVPSTLSVIWWC